jgi:hypothetical protein
MAQTPQAPRFHPYLERVENRSVLIMPRAEWAQIRPKEGTPVPVEITATPMAAVARGPQSSPQSLSNAAQAPRSTFTGTLNVTLLRPTIWTGILSGRTSRRADPMSRSSLRHRPMMMKTSETS